MDVASLHRRLERLALLLTGRPERARRIVRGVAAAHLAPARRPRRRPAAVSPDHLERQVLLACRREPAPAAAGPPVAAFAPLDGLPAQLREAFVLVRVLGRSLREAARAMDCSRTAVRRHLGRADEALRSAAAIPAAPSPAAGDLAALVRHLRAATWQAPAATPGSHGAAPNRRRRRMLAVAVAVAATGGLVLAAWQGWRAWQDRSDPAAAPASAPQPGADPAAESTPSTPSAPPAPPAPSTSPPRPAPGPADADRPRGAPQRAAP